MEKMQISEAELKEIKEALLTELFKDAEMPVQTNLSEAEIDNYLRTLIVLHSTEACHEKLILLQNKFLNFYNEQNERRVDASLFKQGVYEIEDDPLNYEADILAVASKILIEDVESLMNSKPSIDNEILFRAGVEIKGELVSSLKDGREMLFANGFNLNAKRVAKILIDGLSLERVLELINKLFERAALIKASVIVLDLSALKNKENYKKFLKTLKKYLKNANKLQKINTILKIQ